MKIDTFPEVAAESKLPLLSVRVGIYSQNTHPEHTNEMYFLLLPLGMYLFLVTKPLLDLDFIAQHVTSLCK